MSVSTAGSTDTSGYPTPARSLPALFRDRVAATPDAEAFRFPAGGGWTSVSWAGVAETVEPLAAGLLALGLEAEQRVAIASDTRVEWLYADLAVMCAGGATTPVYPTTASDDVAFVLSDSASRFAFAENDAQIRKLRDQREQLPGLEKVITFDGTPDGDWVLGLADLAGLGSRYLRAHPHAVDDAIVAVGPEDLSTLIYTSGTTGRPKGVELPHRCWTYIGAGVEGIGILRADDLQYLWLPLSHSFGKMLAAVQLQIGFATAVDGRVDRIVDNLGVVQPTFMAGPPRIFEKVHGTVTQTLRSQGGLRWRLYCWAFDVGREATAERTSGAVPGWSLRTRLALADRLVLAKIRARLGGRIRLLVSGSAALSPDIADWFNAAGLTLLEGYGLTETGGGACIGDPEHPLSGSVGAPLVGAEVRLAADKEIHIRGPLVMRGYHRLPEETARVLGPDGWFATGDIGELDAVGRLRVTDRKKDLIKTSGGKYIAPQPIEAQFKAICPLASQILVHADRRSYATALIALDPDALAQWGRAHGAPTTDYHELTTDPALRVYLQTCVDRLNGGLNRWETIKDFRILDRDLTVGADDLTPSMKIRRRAIEARYLPLLDTMYAGQPGPVRPADG